MPSSTLPTGDICNQENNTSGKLRVSNKQELCALKVFDYVWEKTKKKEELHSPATQLWDNKDNCYHSSCGCCSNTNVSRVKSATQLTSINPFYNNSVLQVHSNNNPVMAKVKRENQSPLSFFHQRQQMPEKNIGRITPSLLTGTGRVTPLHLSHKIPVSNGIEKAAQSLSTVTDVYNEVKTTDKVAEKKFPLISHLAVPSLNPVNRHLTSFKTKNKTSKKKSAIYNVPTTLDIGRPILPDNLLESRFIGDEILLDMKTECISTEEDLRPVLLFSEEADELKVEQINNEGMKQHGSVSSVVDDSKKIKTELTEANVKRGPGRPRRSRRNSSMSQVVSPTDLPFEEEVLSPGNRRNTTKSTVNLRKRDSSVTSPRADSPASTGPGRPRKCKSLSRGARTPNTPKTEGQSFGFGKSICLSSPLTPHFSPTIKPKLMDAKDLLPTSSDLDQLFDYDEEDISSLKKSNTLDSLMGPPSVEDLSTKLLTTSNATITTAAGITPHDLAQMFPTPPTPATAMSPTSVTHTDQQGQQPVLACMSFLSPEMHHTVIVCENDHLEINLESKSPLNSIPIFNLPKCQSHPIPDLYAPLLLPSQQIKPVILKHLKYTPSWDLSHIPPILSRRPSGNRTLNVDTDTINQISHSESKLTLSLPSPLSISRLSEVATPGFSPVPLSMQDYQSLIVNLTLADSYINWVTSNMNLLNSISSSVQNKTYRLFNIYQSLLWKTTVPSTIDSSLFPEDVSLQKIGDNTLESGVKLMDDVVSSKLLLQPELIEVLLKNFSSSFSAKYFHRMLIKYYTKQELRYKLKNTDQMSVLKNKLLKELHPHLEKALQKPVRKTIWDTPKIEGPLCFQKLNKLVNKRGLQSMMSANSLLFNYEGDALSVSPDAVKYWQSLYLEPFGGARNVAYIVALPESDYVVSSTKQFFKELNSIYESLNLGTHCAIVKDIRDGLIRINQKSVKKLTNITVDDWFNRNDSKLMEKMKIVAQFCKHQLGPYLASLALDSTLYVNKSDSERNVATTKIQNPSSPSTGITATSAFSGGTSQNVNATSNTPAATVYDAPPIDESKTQQPTLVIYMVDPFHSEVNAENQSPLWSYIGFMKCFVEMSSHFSDKLKQNIFLQIVPLEQILQLNLSARSREAGGVHTPELKNLALSVYSRCRANPIMWMKKTEKCMTGFGMCNSRENLITRRQVENILAPHMYTPPYVLSKPSKYLKGDQHSIPSARSALSFRENNVNILFCCYCLSTDDQWLIATCTDETGELSETALIKITYPNRKKNKLIIWNVALRKLWEFITEIVAFSVCSWRIVLSKLGEVGQMELKELSNWIQKKMQTIVLQQQGARPMSPLSEICVPCSVDDKKKGKCIFKSYLLSGCSVDAFTHNDPQIIKSELHLHSLSTNHQPHRRVHPMDSKNHLEIIKFVLEKFDMLSWLTVDSNTGRRQSCLPVHAKMLLNCQQIVKNLSS